jgi:hypothetical protein
VHARHTTEVAERPEVVDSMTLRSLHGEIGFESCDRIVGECWETQAAIGSARLVQQQVTARRSVAAVSR